LEGGKKPKQTTTNKYQNEKYTPTQNESTKTKCKCTEYCYMYMNCEQNEERPWICSVIKQRKPNTAKKTYQA
jgi:hypothetical protein